MRTREGHHSERTAYGARRTEWLRQQGYEVIRVTNEDVYRRLDAVVDMIRTACERRLADRNGEDPGSA